MWSTAKNAPFHPFSVGIWEIFGFLNMSSRWVWMDPGGSGRILIVDKPGWILVGINWSCGSGWIVLCLDGSSWNSISLDGSWCVWIYHDGSMDLDKPGWILIICIDPGRSWWILMGLNGPGGTGRILLDDKPGWILVGLNRPCGSGWILICLDGSWWMLISLDGSW